MSGATPGPWEWDGDPTEQSPEYRAQNAPWVLGKDNTPVLTGDIVCVSPADAHLIASAPELLEALQAVEAANAEMPASVWKQVLAAIAKATGSQP